MRLFLPFLLLFFLIQVQAQSLQGDMKKCMEKLTNTSHCTISMQMEAYQDKDNNEPLRVMDFKYFISGQKLLCEFEHTRIFRSDQTFIQVDETSKQIIYAKAKKEEQKGIGFFFDQLNVTLEDYDVSVTRKGNFRYYTLTEKETSDGLKIEYVINFVDNTIEKLILWNEYYKLDQNPYKLIYTFTAYDFTTAFSKRKVSLNSFITIKGNKVYPADAYKSYTVHDLTKKS